MAFQPPKKEYPKVTTLKHHEMVRTGRPLLVTVKDSKWVDKQSAYVVDLILNSALHNYWTENREIAEGFKKHIGQQVCIIAGSWQFTAARYTRFYLFVRGAAAKLWHPGDDCRPTRYPLCDKCEQ